MDERQSVENNRGKNEIDCRISVKIKQLFFVESYFHHERLYVSVDQLFGGGVFGA